MGVGYGRRGAAVAVAGFANADCKGGSTSCIGSDCRCPRRNRLTQALFRVELRMCGLGV